MITCAESIFSEIFQWLMTSRRHVLLHTHTLWSWLQFLEMGLIFCVILLFIRGEPLSKFSLKCVFWPPLSNEGSDRCSGVFVFEIFAFKVFEFIHEHCHFFHILKFYNQKPQLLSLRSLSTFPTFLSLKRLAFVVCLNVNIMQWTTMATIPYISVLLF